MSRLRIGLLLLLLGSSGFATLSILTKLAYQEGGTVLSVLMLRYAVGAVVYFPIALFSVRRTGIAKRLSTWLMVALLYMLATGSFWSALKLEKVSEVAPIVYLFPGIVVLIERFAYGEALGFKGILALIMGMAGSGLVLGVGLGRPATLMGGLLALVCAVATAMQTVVAAHNVQRGDQLATATSMLLVSAVTFAGLAAIFGWDGPSPRGWVFMGAIAAVGALIPYPYLEGLSRAGASRSAMISVCEPLLIIVLALLVLRETIGSAQAVGIGLILASFLVASTWISKDGTLISPA